MKACNAMQRHTHNGEQRKGQENQHIKAEQHSRANNKK